MADQGGGTGGGSQSTPSAARTLAFKMLMQDSSEAARKKIIQDLLDMGKAGGSLTNIMKRLTEAFNENEAAQAKQAETQSKNEKTLEQLTEQYQSATRGLDLYTRTQQNLQKQQETLQQSGKGSQEELDRLQAAYNLATTEANKYRDAISKIPPEVQSLAQQMQKAEDAIKKEASEARSAKDPHDKLRDVFTDLGRGLASSLASFSLIAGGIVAVGHVIGNAINESVDAYKKLREEVNTVAALNPSLNTKELTNDIRDLEAELGVLSEKLAKVYELAAQAARGNQGIATSLTEQLAGGAQSLFQDPAAWARAATQTMQAYGLSVQDVARIQDVLTLAMQHSAGQGRDMLDLWGSVTKAAAGMQTPLEQNAAAMTVLVQHGGDLQENMRALKGGFDALSTEKSREELKNLGVVTETSTGNISDLLSVMRQLHDLTQGMSPADQSAILRKLFTDRDVVNVMRTLLQNYDELNNLTKEYTTNTDAAEKAQKQFAGTQEANTSKLAAQTQAVKESAGEFFDWQQHIAGLIVTTQEWSDEFDKAFGGMTNHEQFQNIHDFNAEVAQMGSMFDKVDSSISRVTSTFPAAIQSTKDATKATEDERNALGLTVEQYKVYVDWKGKVVDANTGLTTSLKGVSQTFTDVLNQAEAATKGEAFGGFATPEEQNLANIGGQLKEATADLGRLKERANELRSLPIDQNSFVGRLIGSEIDQAIKNKTSLLEGLIAKAKEAAGEIARNSPEGIQAQIQFGFTAADTAATNAIAQAERDATDRANEYRDAIEDLTRKQEALKIALRDNSTPELAAAYSEVTRLTKELADGTYNYNMDLIELQRNLLQVKEDAKGILDPAEESLKSAQKALEDFNSVVAEGLARNTQQLHELEAEQKRVRDEQEALVHAAQQAYDTAQAAYEAIKEETRLQDEQYKNAEGDIERQIELLERLNNQKLSDLKEELRQYKNQLDDLAQREAEELRPLTDQLYQQGLAVKAAQDEIAEINRKYEYLNDLQREYNALKQEELQVQQQEQLLNDRASVENIVARLAAAKKGTVDYLQAQQELVKARNQELRDTRLFELQNQIAAGTAARDEELDAAKQRLEQAQAEYEQTQRQIDAVKQRYEVEKRAIEDNMRLKQREYDDAEKKAADDRTELKNKLEDLKEQQRQYDITQQKAADAAKVTADAAKQALADAKEVQYNANLAQSAIVDGYKAEMQGIADTSALSRVELQKNVTEAKANYDDLKNFWDGQADAIQNKIDKEQLDAREFATSVGKQLSDAKENYQKIKDEIQAAINKLGDQINTIRDTATEAQESAKRIIDAERAKQQAYRATWQLLNAIRTLQGQTGGDSSLLPPVSEPYVPPPNPNPGPYVPPNSDPQGIHHNSMTIQGDKIRTAPTRSISGAQVPVSQSTMQAANMISIGSIVVDLRGQQLPTGDPRGDRYWYEMSDVVVRGLNKGLRDRHGIYLEVSN